MRRPGFLYQPRLEFLAVKALPSLIDGPEADYRDSTESLWHLRFQKCFAPDFWHFPASEEPGQGRRSFAGVIDQPHVPHSARCERPDENSTYVGQPEFSLCSTRSKATGEDCHAIKTITLPFGGRGVSGASTATAFSAFSPNADCQSKFLCRKYFAPS